MKKLLLTILGLLSLLPALAQDFTFTHEGKTLKYTVLDADAKTVEVTGPVDKNDMEGTLIIPDKASDGTTEYTVVSIGAEAFDGCSGLKSVSIPKSVTFIGGYAFDDCRGLTKAEFASIESLCSIKFDISYSNPLKCAHNLYINGKLIEDLVIPESVESIGNYAFSGCSSLKSVSIPNYVTSIGESAFYGCSGLTKAEFASIESLCSIKFENEYANPLAYAQNLYINGELIEDLVIPESVESIGNYAFFGCFGLKSVSIPNSVTSIGDHSFFYCIGLTSVKIPNSVKSIGISAFSRCTALEKIVVPSSVETIGEEAFYGDTSLSSIIIGHGLKKIGDKAFFDCPAKTVCITAQIPPEATAATFSNYSGKLYLQGQKAVEAYHNDPNCWSRFSSYLMVEPTEIKYDGKTTLYLKPGDRIQLTVTLMPDNVTLMQIFWSSTNPEIATVDENGLVTIHADTDNLSRASFTRSCKIIAESLYADGPVLEITINDTTSEVESIELNMTEAKITEGETIQLSVTPAEQTVTWASSDEAVATVDANGLVKAIKPGTATITATTSNNLTATCEVTVVAKPSGIEGVDGDDAPGVRVEGGEIVVDGKAEVFSITGSRVAVSDGGRISGLPHGIYIVRSNGKTVKLKL